MWRTRTLACRVSQSQQRSRKCRHSGPGQHQRQAVIVEALDEVSQPQPVQFCNPSNPVCLRVFLDDEEARNNVALAV